ncbi:hypothetical protein GCM10007301_49970 [Azorhizobium oxalatiphilum]|uniref:Uncharacterized protein n=1 Tax=Azorhizobium oxalatiphilum TaxID=980631 RepID=A0A917CD76_9HYPH|nr:hypothetical protein [Azorhizobium oxalatiphilum]GGF83986.1 hypothetical protein GCM10007301_49970 [Azorhizobium oxalatiphilum]
MSILSALEQAALRSILAETPALEGPLTQQLARALVMERRNTGAGFFTALTVPDDMPAVTCPRVLGQETQARVLGLAEGLGFVLFMEDGRMSALEGYAWGTGDTTALDFTGLPFEIFRAPVSDPG